MYGYPFNGCKILKLKRHNNFPNKPKNALAFCEKRCYNITVFAPKYKLNKTGITKPNVENWHGFLKSPAWGHFQQSIVKKSL